VTPEVEVRIRREHDERMERGQADRSKLAMKFMIGAAILSIFFIVVFLLFIRKYT
jgi:hypothetical protein